MKLSMSERTASSRPASVVAKDFVARLARRELEQCRWLTVEINDLEVGITETVTLQPLTAVVGVGLTAAKIVGFTRLKLAAAYARHNGTARLPVIEPCFPTDSAESAARKSNAALHRVALIDMHWHERARELLATRMGRRREGMDAFVPSSDHPTRSPVGRSSPTLQQPLRSRLERSKGHSQVRDGRRRTLVAHDRDDRLRSINRHHTAARWSRVGAERYPRWLERRRASATSVRTGLAAVAIGITDMSHT